MSTTDTSLQIAAQEVMLAIEEDIEKIKFHMRKAQPDKTDLAFIRVTCIDINRRLEDISYWASIEYRKDGV